MLPLRAVTLAGLEKKCPKNGGVRNANCKTRRMFAHNSWNKTGSHRVTGNCDVIILTYGV